MPNSEFTFVTEIGDKHVWPPALKLQKTSMASEGHPRFGSIQYFPIYCETKILQVNCKNESKCFLKKPNISIWRNFPQSLHKIHIFLKYQFNKIYIEKVMFLRLLNLYLRLEYLSGNIFIEYVLVLKGFDWWMLRGMFPWQVLNICLRQ